MRIRGIIHQQICQLRWHFLACLGLVMVLPLEEAVVSLKDDTGVYSSTMVIVSLMFAPLLTGLIACANVQGDFNEKRYIFWQSKPVNVKLFITLKFFTGLVASLIIIACPVIFGLVLSIFCKDYLEDEALQYFIPFPVLIAILMYCLCFGCNVLVRRTARAWLIGMLLGAFILVIPFILPLNYKDFVSDVMFGAWGYYPAIILIASAAAFVFALYAAQHDWHLKTNLKGLLWVGAGLVFVLMMIFSRQVANIKVLQEKEIEHAGWGWNSLDSVGNRVLFQERSYIDIDNNNKISFSNINSNPDDIAVPITRIEGLEGYHIKDYPGSGKLMKAVGDNLYRFIIYAYYRRELIERGEKPPSYNDIYEKVYLRSYKYTGNSWIPMNELDISDCLSDSQYPRTAMRLIDNKIITFVNNSFVVVDVTNPVELKLINKQLNVLKNRWGYYHERQKKFSIPLVPVEEIGMEDRIKLTIDWYYSNPYFRNEIFKSSIVDIHDDKIKFLLVDDEDIARFDVTRWDNENIYCKFSTTRPFTILEQLTGRLSFRSSFVENDRLYCWERDTLLVFDIRSGHRIRKLGHFVRMDYEIEDIVVLEDGNILLCLRWEQNLGPSHPNTNKQKKNFLCLLENPG